MPPLTSAARGRTVCAPTEKKKKRAVNDLWEGEFSRRFAAPPFDKGGFGRRAFFRSRSRLLRGHPHPPPSGAPSPLKGEGLRAADSRPYREGEIFWDGRVRTPAPTKFGESSGFAVRADGLGGPRAHSVRPYSKGRPYGDIRMSQTGPREGQAPPLRFSRNSSGIG